VGCNTKQSAQQRLDIQTDMLSCHHPHIKKGPKLLSQVQTAALSVPLGHTSTRRCIRPHMPAARSSDDAHAEMNEGFKAFQLQPSWKLDGVSEHS